MRWLVLLICAVSANGTPRLTPHVPTARSLPISNYAALGPFVIGKGELDGDPLEAVPGGAAAAAWQYIMEGRSRGVVRRSELLTEGKLAKWQTLRAAQGVVTVEYPNVDWQALVNSVGGMELLEVQTAVLGLLQLSAASTVTITCSGVAAFHIDSRPPGGSVSTRGPFAGNAYFGQERIQNTLILAAGYHVLRLRVRVKHRGQFFCRAAAVPTTLSALKPPVSTKFVPDWLKGSGPIGGVLRLAFDFRNPTTAWLDVTAALPLNAPFVVSEHQHTTRVAPSQALTVQVVLDVAPDANLNKCPSPFSVRFTLLSETGDTATWESRVTLRCRRRGQSMLATFVDCDGSVQHLALVHPPESLPCPAVGCPILLTLHGTSISASDSADAFKVKYKGDSDYTFGWNKGWLLAPSRHGAHNWEGVGRQHALAAVDWLAHVTSSSKQPAASDQLVVAGHSMGGHGAWLFAVLEPGRTLCLNANAGWIRKEQYGDSNTLWLHDAALHTVISSSTL